MIIYFCLAKGEISFGMSSNGRTSDSGSENWGSNPCIPAILRALFVQWPRTSGSQPGDRGSNPLESTIFFAQNFWANVCLSIQLLLIIILIKKEPLALGSDSFFILNGKLTNTVYMHIIICYNLKRYMYITIRDTNA